MTQHRGRRRTSTLSISLPRELADEVSERVRSGLYTSASELIREALRMLLKVEEAHRAQLERMAGGTARPAPAASRFATTMHLFDLGAALREEKLLRDHGELSRNEARERLRMQDESLEAGPGLRIAPERLEKLTLRE